MAKKHDCRILPKTLVARIALALSFVGGLVVIYLFLGLLVLGITLGYMHHGMEVTYVNRTDTTIAVYINYGLETTIPPGEEVTVEYREFYWRLIDEMEVRDTQGRVISSTYYSVDDLKRLDYRIVVED